MLSSSIKSIAMLLKKMLVVLLLAAAVNPVAAEKSVSITSPDGLMRLGLLHRNDGSLIYQIIYKGRVIIAPSGLGMQFKSPGLSLTKFTLSGLDSSLVDESWKPVWGEVSNIRNNYRQLSLQVMVVPGVACLSIRWLHTFADGAFHPPR